MEVDFRPSLLDNLEHWKFFDDDTRYLDSCKEVKSFMIPKKISWKNI
jgi:hypothetical protein